MSKKLNALLKSLGVDREEVDINGELGLVKSYDFGQAKSLSDISDEEYKALCQQHKMLSDGSDLSSEEDRAKYLESLTEDQKNFDVLWRDRILTIRGSDETVDRSQDIIRVDGWKLDDFEKNPVFLSQHNQWDNPVGKAIKVWKEYNDKDAPNGKSLMFRIYFHPEAVSKEADAHYKLFKAGILNAVSVGFRAIKAHVPSSEAEAQALGMKGYGGVVYLEQTLRELSAVTLPCNQNALRVKSLEEVDALGLLGIKAEIGDAPKEGATQTENNADEKEDVKALLDLVKSLKDELVDIKSVVNSILENTTFKNAEQNSQEDSEEKSSLLDLIHKGLKPKEQ